MWGRVARQGQCADWILSVTEGSNVGASGVTGPEC